METGPGPNSSISSSKRVSNPLLQDSTDSYRQHNSGCLYQQRGGDEIGLPVCPTVENTVLVYQTVSNPRGTSHPDLARPFKQSGHFIQKCSKLYAPGGTSPKWTCLPPGSTTNCHSLCHRSQTPRHGQWMHSASPGRTWTHTPFHQQPSWAKWWRSYRTTLAIE